MRVGVRERMRKKGAYLGIIPAGPGREARVRCQCPPRHVAGLWDPCARVCGPSAVPCGQCSGRWWEVALSLVSKVSGTVKVCSASHRTDLDLRSISGNRRVRTLRNPRVDPLCLSCLEPQSQSWPCCSQAQGQPLAMDPFLPRDLPRFGRANMETWAI